VPKIDDYCVLISETVVSVAVAAAARLDGETMFCGGLDNLLDLMNVIWKGYGDRCWWWKREVASFVHHGSAFALPWKGD
jgi:hypothetical protein